MTTTQAGFDGGDPTLVLNRFLVSPGSPAVDLATGVRVLLLSPPAGVDAGAGWADCAGRLVALRHPALARLLDFGTDQDGQWVEAWESDGDAPSPWPRPSADEAAAIFGHAEQALDAVGCRLCRRSHDDLRPCRGRYVLVPAAGVVVRDDDAPGGEATRASSPSMRKHGNVLAPSGLSGEGATAAIDIARDARPSLRIEPPTQEPGIAVTWQVHEEYFGLLDVLDARDCVGPQSLVIGAPPGSGVTTLFAMLAQAARRKGWVPVTSRLVNARLGPWAGLALGSALRRRHVLVLDDLRVEGMAGCVRRGEALARFLGALQGASGRPHLILTAADGHPDPDVSLSPWPRARLIGTVHNLGFTAKEWSRLCHQALRQSGGWPGRFVRALVHDDSSTGGVAYPHGEEDGMAVREELEVATRYGAAEADQGLVRAREHARMGLSLVGRGRHADAARLLMGALGAMARRGADAEAGRIALSLARLLWRRGALEQAREALGRAHEHCTRAGDTDGMIAGLLLKGWVLMHADRLEEAESVLLTAKAAAEHAARPFPRASAVVSLAACYRWQERWADTTVALSGLPDSPAPIGAPVDAVAETPGQGSAWLETADPGGLENLAVGCPIAIAAGLRALVACGNGDAAETARSLRALQSAESDGRAPAGGWFADALALRLHGAVGDTEAIRRVLDRALASARQSHDVVGALELRVSSVEALLDAGDTKGVASALARLARWRRARIPALHRRRIDRLEQTATGTRAVRRAAEPALARPEALRVLSECRDASDDGDLVGRVCEGIRKTVGAHVVAVFGAAEGLPHPMGRAGAGGADLRTGLLTRVLTAGLYIGPERTALGVESAAPIRYGGLTVGAVYVRWTALGRPDATGVRSALTAAALAVAPAVRGLLDVRLNPDQDPALQDELFGTSEAIEAVRSQVRRAAAAPFPVLVQGESGTGKELVARALHRASPRRLRRFCAINCAALGDDLFEAELFGHARGAFTGAVAERAGLFEEADGGTLLLDEVGELSARAQAKLLRAIQEGEIRRIGENIVRRVDARVVAATNRSLHDEVRAGRFRQDLLFRLDVVRITMPPLRERPDDVAELAARFWRQATARVGSQAVLAPSAMSALTRYAWPGNVRELQNVLSAVAVRAPRRGPIGPAWLPEAVTGESGTEESHSAGTLAEARRQFDERYIRGALARHGGQRARTAVALGVTRQGLAKLIDRLGIEA